jgi:glucose/arabinose dehydrogenase
VLEAKNYSEGGEGQFLGIALDHLGRLYLVGNRFDFSVDPAVYHVTIYRTDAPLRRGAAFHPRPWVQATMPFAIDVFQHSVSNIAEGPDHYMYVSSGSRTDHGEAGNDPHRSKEGETPLTSCIWRLDERRDHPAIEIFARGLRNAFGFCWDDHGRMFATENGPNANPPEEVNLIEAGKHYGFPFQFSDWDHKAYPDQPDPPAGLKIEPPLAKLDPHSSPSGIIAYKDVLLVARFGNLIGEKDVGFDIVKVDPTNGAVKSFLAPIARPTDLHLAANGKIYVCEFQRGTRNGQGEFAGRILEISTPDDISPKRPGTH